MLQDYYTRKCNRVLEPILGNLKLVEKWWLAPNKVFAYQKPKDIPIVWVWKYILDFRRGFSCECKF